MACRYTYNGTTYSASEFMRVLSDLPPMDASKFMPGVNPVPNAPFVNNTDDWAMLAFKRMVRVAAEGGFDKIAWTTGEQQAERYDLSKQVQSIEYMDTGRLLVMGTAGGVIHNDIVTEDKLPDIIGKEMTERLLAEEPRNRPGLPSLTSKSRLVSGDGLKVGGEGMKGFYDRILPSAVNKWAKKFGGKVGQAAINLQSAKHHSLAFFQEWMQQNHPNTPQPEIATAWSRGENDRRVRDFIAETKQSEQHSLDLTPQMRDAALQGQPLFSIESETLADTDLTPAEKASRDRQSVNRKGLQGELNRQQGRRDAEASGLVGLMARLLGKANIEIIYARDEAGLEGLVTPGYMGQLRDQQQGREPGMFTAGLYIPPRLAANGKPFAVVFTGNNLDARLQAFTGAHEIAGHHGLRALLGPALDKMLDIAYQNATVKAVADSMYRSRKMAAKVASGQKTEREMRLLSIEEALADLAAAVRTKNFQRIKDKHGVEVPKVMQSRVRSMLDTIVQRIKELFRRKDVRFSDGQVRQLLEASWQAAQGKSATMSVMGANGALEQVVFHGTPHTVDRFSLQKIGTGEGAQAYGWGLYFASAKDVAQHYASTLSRRAVMVNGKAIGAQQNIRDVFPNADETFVRIIEDFRSLGTGNKSDLRQQYEAMAYGATGKRRVLARELLGRLKTFDIKTQPGNLYRVDVPEDGDLLDWDAVNGQPPNVTRALKRLNARLKIFEAHEFIKAPREGGGTVEGPWYSVSGHVLYKELTARLGSARAASEALQSVKIPGLRYLDGNSRSDGKGSANYVIWGESAIGQPQSALESTEDQTQSEAFKNWFGQSVVTEDGKAGGKPLVVYHGSTSDIDSFREEGPYRGGIIAFFSTSPEFAGDYAGEDRGANITPTYLRIERPFDFRKEAFMAGVFYDETGGPQDQIDINRIKMGLGDDVELFDDTGPLSKEQFSNVVKSGGWDALESSEFVEWLHERGYDGIVTLENGAVNYGIFSPEQAKSALANNGNFDPANPSILESVEAFTLSDNPTPADLRIPGEITLDPLHKAGVKGILARLGKKFTDLKPAALALVPLQEMDDFTPKAVQKDGTTVSAQPAVATYIQLQNDMQAMRNTLYVDYDKTAQDLHAYSTVGAGIKGFFGKAVNQQGRDLFAIMHDSTIAGVDPSEQNVRYKDPGKAAKYRDLQERYNAIPKEGQDLFKAVRDAYAAQTDLLDEVIEANATRAAEITTNRARRKLEDRERAIREDGDLNPLEKAKAQAAARKAYDDTVNEGGTASKIAALRKMLESNRVPKPYFPLKRYGKYWVSVLKDGKLAGFSKFETAAEQSEFSKSMVAQGYSTRLKYEGDAAQTREMIDPKFVADVEEILTGLPDQIRDDVWQAYLERMPDMSLRKSFIHRKNVAGYHFDALKAFGSTLFHGSHQIARLKYGMEMAEAIDVAKEQANALRESNPEGALAADMVAGELDKRHAFIMNPTNAKWAQQVSGAAFLYSLGANPAHLFLNATQTVMLGVPVLGTRYGFGRASKALTKAARDFAKGKGHLEKANLTTDELRAFRELQASGIIEKSQAHDIAGIGAEGVEYDSVRKKVMDKIGWFMHQSERFNREVTAMAGYRLARAEGRSHEAAMAEASKHVYQIHFDYSNAARARVMQGDMAKALLVFRNYQANMIYRLFRDIHQSIRGESPQVKREARKQLGAIMGMYGLFAGTMGVPFYGLAMALAGAFDDEDDPVTAEQQFVNGTVEFLGPTAAKVLLRGIPGTLFDVDLTERIGMGNLWFRSPNQEMEGRDAYYYWMEQLLGAGLAPVKGVFDGINLAMKGQIQRGIERASPAALRNPMQAIRMAQEGGVTSLDGDLIKEVNGGDMLTKALGFQPLSVSEQYEANNEIKGADRRLSNRRQRLMNRYFLARQMGDDTAEAMADIQAFNLKNPEYAITRDTMQRSAKTRARNSANSEGGIVMTRRMRRLQDRLNTEETE